MTDIIKVYPVEADESAERAKAELKVPDPEPARALGVLTGAKKQDEQKVSSSIPPEDDKGTGAGDIPPGSGS